MGIRFFLWELYWCSAVRVQTDSGHVKPVLCNRNITLRLEGYKQARSRSLRDYRPKAQEGTERSVEGFQDRLECKFHLSYNIKSYKSIPAIRIGIKITILHFIEFTFSFLYVRGASTNKFKLTIFTFFN